MIMPSQYYEESLYPLQDGVMNVLSKCGVRFFLTGGTALELSIIIWFFPNSIDTNVEIIYNIARKGGPPMDEIIKMLDKNIQYVSHEIQNDRIYIYVESNLKEVICPYCKQSSIWVHSRYLRKLQDLPIQGKKVTIVIDNRKFFCKNPDCAHKTFAENFAFAKQKATKTDRLQEEILSVSLNQSSVSASRHLKQNTCDVGKSTICTLIKRGL